MQFEPLAPVPAVTLANQLRQIPLFRFASVDELFRISSISQQVRYEAGATVQAKGSRADYIQVLLEGTFELHHGESTEGAEPRKDLVSPPALLGFQEVLEGTSLQDTAIAESESVALVMPAEEFRTLLAANIELAQGLFGMLLEQTDEDAPPSKTSTSMAEQAPLPKDTLKTVDKVLFLQSVPMLARASADELYELAAITREVSFQSDEVLFSEGHPSSVLVMLSGEVRLERPSAEAAEAEETTDRGGLTVGPGECLGAQETLAGSHWSWRARATEPGRVLRVEREALYELLADHIDLLQGIFGATFSKKWARPEISIAKQ